MKVWDEQTNSEIEIVEAASEGVFTEEEFLQAITEVAEEANFDQADKSYWQCTDFSAAVCLMAEEIGLPCELWSARVAYEKDLGEINAGEEVGHSYFKLGDTFYDFTASQTGGDLPFPYVGTQPLFPNSHRDESLKDGLDPSGYGHWHKEIWDKLHTVTSAAEPRFHWKKEVLDHADGFEINVTELGTGKAVGNITVEQEYVGDEDDVDSSFFMPYAEEPFIGDLMSHEYVTDIRALHVEREFQGQGIAKYIYNLALKEIKKRYPNHPVFINASPLGGDISLDDLIQFYTRAGFKMLKKYPKDRNAALWLEDPSAIKLVADLEDDKHTESGIENTDYPYYHVSDYPETPRLNLRGDYRVEYEPYGIYLFPKKSRIKAPVFIKKKYRWDARLKPGARVLDLEDEAALEKLVVEIEPELEKVCKQFPEILKSDQEIQYLNVALIRFSKLLAAKGVDPEFGLRRRKRPGPGETAEPAKPRGRAPTERDFIETLHEWLDDGRFRNMNQWAALVLCWRHAETLTEFLKQKYDVIQDLSGKHIAYGEPQLIVLRPELIDWLPVREENQPDRDVYRLAAALSDKSGKWVHFSKLPEVKINPRQFHQDPAGIYLFPKEFKTEGNWDTFPHKFEVELDSSMRVLDLATLTKPEMEEMFVQMTEMDLSYLGNWDWETKTGEKAIDSWWEALKNFFILKNNGLGPGAWNKAFRKLGYDAIFDDTQSIHSSEEQLLVLNPKSIKGAKELFDRPKEFDTVQAVADRVSALCEKYGEITQEGPKKKTEYGETGIQTTLRVVANRKHATWKVYSRRANKADKIPTWVGVSLMSDSTQLAWKSGRSWGTSLLFTKWEAEWPKAEKEVIAAMEKVFVREETVAGSVTSIAGVTDYDAEEVTATSKYELEQMAQKYLREIFKMPHLPLPTFKIANNLNSDWLGICKMSTAYEKPEITVQRSITNDPVTLERIVAHEMIHYVMYLTDEHYVNLFKLKSRIEYDAYRAQYMPDPNYGHGKGFQDWAAKINAVKGKDYVTETSDTSYVKKIKDFFVVIGPSSRVPGKMRYGHFQRMTPLVKDTLTRFPEGKVFRVNDADLIADKPLGRGNLYVPENEQIQKKLKDLYETGTPIQASTEKDLYVLSAEDAPDDLPLDELVFNPATGEYGYVPQE